jgi:hypothetical protein
MNGCRAIAWTLVITPVLLLIVLFALSWRAGLLGLGVVLGVAAVYLGAGFLLSRSRRWCPACHHKKLKCINWFRANPPPNWSFYRCDDCGAEFVKVDGQVGLVERNESRFKDSPGWEAT